MASRPVIFQRKDNDFCFRPVYTNNRVLHTVLSIWFSNPLFNNSYDLGSFPSFIRPFLPFFVHPRATPSLPQPAFFI